MEDKLINCLEALGITVYNLQRPEEERECIVYNYSEDTFSTSDNIEDITKYVIYLNLYCDTGLNNWKKKIKKALESNGFSKMYIPPANFKDEAGLINQAFNYTYLELNP